MQVSSLCGGRMCSANAMAIALCNIIWPQAVVKEKVTDQSSDLELRDL